MVHVLFLFRTEYHFTFDNVFEICDDVQVLNKLGLTLGLDNGSCSPENLKLAKELMPKSLEGLLDGKYHKYHTRKKLILPYIIEMAIYNFNQITLKLFSVCICIPMCT